MPTYVYKLIVTLPPGSDEPGWEPPNYEQVYDEKYGYRGDEMDYGPPPFRWPSRRLSFTEATAKRRAALLESYGAKVEIVRSPPVEFLTADPEAGDHP